MVSPPPVASCDCEGTPIGFEGRTTSSNNLGGYGPDFDTERSIRFVGVDTDGLYDLVVTNTTFYAPNLKDYDASTGTPGRGAEYNGVFGKFGNINIMQGVEAEIEMCFVTTGSEDDYVPLEKVYFTFFDFDSGAAPSDATEMHSERITISDQTAWFVNHGEGELVANDAGTMCQVREYAVYEGVMYTNLPMYAAPDDSPLDGAPDGTDWQSTAKYGTCPDYGNGAGEGDTFYTNYPCTEIAVSNEGGNTYSFSSTVRGFGCDNPEDPDDLNDVQLARTVAFEFQDVACIYPSYGAGGEENDQSGRNFLLDGFAFECFCDSPPPPPPPPLSSPPPPPPPPPPPSPPSPSPSS